MSDLKISRKDLLKLGGAGLGAAALTGVQPLFAQTPGGDQPNILFITVDQLCSLADVPNDLPLPNIRRLIQQGRNFTNYHVHQAPCGPSRSMIYTGQYVQRTGVYTNPPGEYAQVDPESASAVELPPDFPTIGKMLREQGYYTAYKGKWHLSMVDQRARAKSGRTYPDTTDALEPYGFSDYGFDGEHTGMMWAGFSHDGFIAAESINLLHRFSKGATGGKPWYLAVNFVNPHDIMFYGEDDEATSGGLIGLRVPPPRVPPYDKEWNTPLPASYYKDDLSTKPSAQRLAGPGGAAALRDEAAWRTYRSYYFNCIRDVDRYIGQVLDALDQLGMSRNTVVFLTSDHGERAGAHRLSGKGGDMYKETVRVPLIVRGPGVPASGDTAALAGSVDLSPTLLTMAKVDAKALAERFPQLPGVDLSPALADASAGTQRDKRGVLFTYTTATFSSRPAADPPRRTLLRGVFDGRHKFARYFAVNEHHIPTDWKTLLAHNDLELYDTQTDPDEVNNLARESQRHRSLILSLNAKINRLIATEVGPDDGSIYPGETSQYQLKV